MTEGATTGSALRVCTVTTSYPRRDGDHAGHFVASLCHSLADRGHEVVVVAPHERGCPERETSGGVEVRRFRYLPDSLEAVAYGDGVLVNVRSDVRAAAGLPFFVRAMRRAVAQASQGCDLVHAHWAPTAALAALDKGELPYVVTLHGSDVSAAGGTPGLAGMLDRAVRGASGLIAVAGSQTKRLAERGLRAEGDIVATIPNGVDEELLERDRAADPDVPFTIVFVGRLIPEKGVDDLFEAYLGLPDTPALVFVGDGERRARLEARVAELGLGHKVRFTGYVPRERALDEIAAADVLALPSYAEGCPLTVLEALALGTPVVGSSVGAIPDFLPESLVVEPGDVGALSAVLAELAIEPERRELLGREGRAEVHGCCTWPRVAARVEDVYRAVLAASSREGDG